MHHNLEGQSNELTPGPIPPRTDSNDYVRHYQIFPVGCELKRRRFCPFRVLLDTEARIRDCPISGKWKGRSDEPLPDASGVERPARSDPFRCGLNVRKVTRPGCNLWPIGRP